MFRGERINVTEDRAVLHTALRLPADAELVVDGQDVVADVHEVLRRVYDFADRVRSGEWTGVTGERIRTVVNIGIGGSDLGPVMAYEALAPYVQDGLECRFISNIDPTDAATTLAGLDPATTLFIVSSKTFGTLETLTNARLCRAWLLDGLGGHDEAEAVARHFVAVSTALDKVADFGIDPDNAFGFWDWVGGRYSMDSAIGTSLVVAIGPERFAELLAGMHAMDEHFRTTELGPQRPGADGAAQRLVHRVPRRADPRRAAVRPAAAPVPGLPAAADDGVQRQGRPLGRLPGDDRHRRGVLGRARDQRPARLLPADPPGHPAGARRLHRRSPGRPTPSPTATPTSTSCSWPTSSPRPRRWRSARPPTRCAPRAPTRRWCRPGSSPATGRRPRSWRPELSPSVLGQLIALYEHVTFTQGVVWGIDSFDQWGVELGKQLAQQVTPAVSGDDDALAAQDASTRSLIGYYRRQRSR